MSVHFERPEDELVRTVSRDGGIAVRVVVASALVAEAARRHHCSPTASVALGRALMGATLLGASGKSGETVQIQIRGDGPLGSIFAISDASGRTRGYASNPLAHPPPVEGQLDVAGAVGRGVLTVVRQRPGSRSPYSGIVPLVHGTVAQDIAHYLTESEQTPAAVGLGVYLADRGVHIDAAGGFFAHALPGASDEELDQVEANVQGFPGPGELVREGIGADGIVDRLLAGLGSRERHRCRPVFHCGCGPDRVRRAVALLGREEILGAAERHQPMEICCRFCGEKYTLGEQELRGLAGDA